MIDKQTIIKEIHYENSNSLFDAISYNGNLHEMTNEGFVFRGHASESYQLIPRALRRNEKDDFWKLVRDTVPDEDSDVEFYQWNVEYRLLQYFYKQCDINGLKVPRIDRLSSESFSGFERKSINNQEKWLPSDLYELAGLAQHYGIPTRLLDWTQDIYVALYFAATDALKNKSVENDNIIIWALNVPYINFLKENGNRTNLKIIKPEYGGNPNLAAQQGLFTLWEIDKVTEVFVEESRTMIPNLKHKTDRTPLDKLLQKGFDNWSQNYTQNIMNKISISNQFAEDILKYLHQIRYDASRIFPGYGGAAKSVLEVFPILHSN
jgi:hypothetical protein